MEYHLELKKGLGINPEDVVAAWNGDRGCWSLGRAACEQGAAKDLGVIPTIVISVASGVAANAIYDQITMLLKRMNVPTPFQVHKQSDERAEVRALDDDSP